MVRLLASVVPTAAVVASAACGDGGYTVVVDAQAAPQDVTQIEVALGSPCAGQPSGGPFQGVVQGIELTGDRANLPVLTPVEPGTYGLVGRALSASCQVVAWGCRDHELRAAGGGELRVSLSPLLDGSALDHCGQPAGAHGTPPADASLPHDGSGI